MVTLKKIAPKFIIISILIALLLCANMKQIFAADDEKNYELVPLMISGPNLYAIEKGKVVNEILSLWNNATSSFEEYMIEPSKISVEVSDENLVSIENNIITAKEEGELTVKYTYTYKDMDYEYEGSYNIYDGRFSNYFAPVINKPYMDLKVGGESKNIYIGLVALDSVAYAYEPINYNYQWKIEDESIAKIEETSVDSESKWKSSVNVTPLKVGTTKITCTVSTADGNESITKTINLTVTGDSTPTPTPNPNPSNPEVNPKQDPSETGDKTVAKTILPAAGKSSIIIAIIVILSIAAIVFYNKRKID